MKKPRASKKLNLSRETLANLDHLKGGQLEKVAGGTTGGSSCNIPRCTCPPA
jgi:hypothetical protein